VTDRIAARLAQAPQRRRWNRPIEATAARSLLSAGKTTHLLRARPSSLKRGIMKRPASRIALFAIIVLGLDGCAKSTRRTEDPDTTNLRRLYQAFVMSDDRRNRGPKDMAELKHWLGELGEKITPDEMLISRRDGQPFVIFFGNRIRAEGGDTVLAYEKEGKEGKRFVLTLGGNVKSMTDEEFAKARFAGKKA
jgi:hypothetical protein